jgi:hypothetical protein
VSAGYARRRTANKLRFLGKALDGHVLGEVLAQNVTRRA